MAQPTSPIHQTNPLIFSEYIDSTGKAKIRGRLVATASSPEISQQDLDDVSSMGVVSIDNQPLDEVPFPSKQISRTTAWRKRKAALSQSKDTDDSIQDKIVYCANEV